MSIEVSPLLNEVKIIYKTENSESFYKLIMSIIERNGFYKLSVGGPAKAIVRDFNLEGNYTYNHFYVESKYLIEIQQWAQAEKK